MKNRHKARAKASDMSGKRVAAGRSRWIGVSLIVGVAMIGLGLVVSKRLNSSPTARSTTLQPKPETPSAASGATVPDSEKDRALRSEQLQAAEKLLADFPTNDDVVYLAGLVHNEQGDSEQAMKLWARSLELDATRADANESLGYALLLRDEYEGAEKYFRKALQLDATSGSARFRLATALSQQGRLQEVVSLLEQGPKLSAEEHRVLAEACQQLKQHEKARTHYEAAIGLKPDLAEAYYGLSQALAQLGDAEKSRGHLEKFSALRKESEEQARRVRATFDALAVTRKSVAQTHTDVGRVYMVLRNSQKAEELWRRAAALDAQNLLCRVQLAVLCQQTKRYQEALQFYEEAAKLDPADGLTRLNMGNVCLKLNLPDAAESAFKEVIALEPNRAEGHSALARLYLQTNRKPAEAERLAAVAANLSPEAPYFALLSQARASNGDRAGALKAIDRAIELQPGNAQYAEARQRLSGKP